MTGGLPGFLCPGGRLNTRLPLCSTNLLYLELLIYISIESACRFGDDLGMLQNDEFVSLF